MSTPYAIQFDPEKERPEDFQRFREEERARIKAESQPPPEPGAVAEGDVPDSEDYHWEHDEPAPEMELKVPSTDVENAYQFAAAYHVTTKYCPPYDCWLLWTPTGWRWDRVGRITERQKCYVLAIEDTANAIKDSKAREPVVKKAKNLAQNSKINALTNLAKSDPRLVVTEDMLDRDPWLAGVQNGVVNLKTGEFSPPRPEILVTKRLGTSFDADATCPVWEAFLARVIPDDSLRRFLKASVGYALTGVTQEHCFWFLYGSGSNGKTTFIEAVRALFNDYARTASESLIGLKKNGDPPKAELAQLPGVRYLSGSEVTEGVKLNEALVKSLTGDDTISAEAKYIMPINFKPCLKLWLFGNYRPTISGTDTGIWRRVRLIPFTEEISAEEKDGELPTKLLAELPGILNWALEGLRDWRENGFVLPDVVATATAEYRADSDVIGSFIAATLQKAEGYRVLQKDLYRYYKDWCEEEGLKSPCTARSLNKRLEDRGFVKGKHAGEKTWKDWAVLSHNSALRNEAA